MKNHVILFIIAILTLIPLSSYGDTYVTAGNGQIYSFATLVTIEGSGVSQGDDCIVVNRTVEISAGDSFVMDSGVMVRFADGAELIIKGDPTLTPEEQTTLTKALSATTPYNVEVWGGESQIEVSNLNFEFVGLRCYNPNGMYVHDCQFTEHCGTQSAALMMGPDEAPFHIKDCYFANNTKAAIGGAANYFCPVKIEDCSFYHNSTANGNIPQLNLTASQMVEVTGCMIEGDPSLTMVGGIAVSNFYTIEGFNVNITGNTIIDNRYGITTMGMMDVVIADNMLKDNCHETNPNNGGSGISLYDPYMKQTVMVRGNHIENSLWGITVIGCGNVNIGRIDVEESDEQFNPGRNVFKNNGNGGILYDLYNNSTNTIYAQGNQWNVAEQTEKNIESVIFHQHDNPALGEVIFMPPMEMSGVDMVNVDVFSSEIYSLNGMKVSPQESSSLQAGIYIINGKKRIVRK